MNLSELKSGSDIRGTAYGEHVNLTEDVAGRVAMAYVQLLCERYRWTSHEICIAIGRDSRVSGERLARAFAEGVAAAGANAALFGMCTTPSMYHCLIKQPERYSASVMVTASHHPFDKNGLKFFTRDGGLNSKDIEYLLRTASQEEQRIKSKKGLILTHGYLREYIKDLKNIIKTKLHEHTKPLQGMHIVVDAGNGAGGFYADMLADLGADISGSQYLDPDGFFPNHAPNPENAKAMSSLSQAVLKAHADLGVIFDADCDRAAIVDGQGKEINRNRLIALISCILLQKTQNIIIVTDSVTSTGLSRFIAANGGKHHRFKRGYRNVIDEAIRLNAEGLDAPLAIETSGHCALRDNHYIDDGMYLATLLILTAKQLSAEGKVLADLIAALEEPAESTERRIRILDKDFRSVGERVIHKLEEYFQKQDGWDIVLPNFEGIRVNYAHEGKRDGAWFLLRLSVHDPVMPLNIESESTGAVEKILAKLRVLLQDEVMLDISALE